MTVSTAHPPQSGPAETRRAIWNTIRGSSGNLVEWYDVYVYTVFASYVESKRTAGGPVGGSRRWSAAREKWN